jgi:hypothetical protein
MAPTEGVLFDLFSGLLDSQPAYDEVAGSAALGNSSALHEAIEQPRLVGLRGTHQLRATQRKPMWHVVVSTASAWRAAGR